jgi:hypothetical protein
MAVKQKWSDLGQGKRRLIVVAGVPEAALKVAMLVDLKRRPPEQVRGAKWLWSALAFVNLLGPVSYFAWGRRHQPSCRPRRSWRRPGSA